MPKPRIVDTWFEECPPVVSKLAFNEKEISSKSGVFM